MFRSMRGRRAVVSCALALALALAWSPLAFAQAVRTWVSGVGDDANPCARTAPCKTFAGAINKTAAGGTINVLDPGAYGVVTITKSITIQATGEFAGLTHAGSNGIVVSAGAADVVTLRGLTLDGVGGGLNGIRFLQGRLLVLEHVEIQNTGSHGIDFQPAGAATLSLHDVSIGRTGLTTAGTGAINIAPQAGGSAALDIDDVRLVDNRFGIAVAGPATGTIRNATIASTDEDGVVVNSATSASDILLDNVAISDAGSNGLAANGANAVARISGTSITGSAQGVLVSGNGRVISFGDNRIGGNVVNGAPTQTQPQQ